MICSEKALGPFAATCIGAVPYAPICPAKLDTCVPSKHRGSQTSIFFRTREHMLQSVRELLLNGTCRNLRRTNGPADGWDGPAVPRPARRKVLRGIKKHKEHVPCHTNPHYPPSARSASISVRIASTLSASINAGRSFGN